MNRFVALMRGINVGGNNKLPMKDLAAIFAEAGATAVRTYIQSGNVIFEATQPIVRALPSRVSDAIEKRHGFRPPVILRSQEELAVVLQQNPFLRRGTDPDSLHVMFLADRPKAAAAASLDPARSAGDEFAVVGREIYLCCPNGLARTKLTNAWFDSRLQTVSTARNWRTVLKLVDLCGGGELAETA